MKIALSSLIILTVVILSCQTKPEEQKDSTLDDPILQQRQILKNFAFCACLKYSNPPHSSIIDDGSMAAYFERGSYPVRAYEIIDSMAKVFSKKQYISKHDKPLDLMKSLDFYNSSELQQKIAELDTMLEESSHQVKETQHQ